MTPEQSEAIDQRLRQYAEEAVRDLAEGLPHRRLARLRGEIYWDESIGDDQVQFNATPSAFEARTFRFAVTATMKNAEFDLQPMQNARPWAFHRGRFFGDYRELPAPSVTKSDVVLRNGSSLDADSRASTSDSTNVRARLRRYAEDALLDLTAGVPHSRLCRLQGEMTWQETIGGDEILLHAMLLEFTDEYLHPMVEACLENAPAEMIRWNGYGAEAYGELPSVSIDDIVRREPVGYQGVRVS